jgi:hypothetical protein
MGSWKLKPVLAVVASFGMMAAVGQAANEPITWSKGVVPANAVIAAGSKEQPIHICRLPMADKSVHPGKAFNGNCYVGFGGKEIKAPLAAAEVLGSSATVGWADVTGGKVPANALSAGVAGGVTMHFCRTRHEGKTPAVGKEYKGNCYYGFAGKEIKTAEFQVMGLTRVAAAPGAPAPAVAPVKPAATAAAPGPTAAPARPTAPAPAPAPTAAQARPTAPAAAPAPTAAPARPTAPATAPATARPAAPAPTAAQPGGIRVLSAEINVGGSANCQLKWAAAAASIAPAMQAACNGKQTCDFTVDFSVITLTGKEGCKKQLRGRYTCPDSSPRFLTAADEGKPKIVNLACPPAPKK